MMLSVRKIPALLFLMLLISPGVANGQSFELYASAGPTITDTGNSFAAGVGVSPTSRLSIGFSFERTHLSSRTSREGNVVSSFRGGTLLLGTAELRFAPFGRGRFGPFGVVGVAAGVSHPNVNDMFPNRVTNRVGAMFLGGGINVPLGERFAMFADARMMFGAEGVEGIVAVAPVRAGIAWRF
jgi:hypothetical protein